VVLRLGFHFPRVRRTLTGSEILERRLREAGGGLKIGGERRSGAMSRAGEQ
jgi:hypothetical protein